jgi:anti-anti-sigma factor
MSDERELRIEVPEAGVVVAAGDVDLASAPTLVDAVLARLEDAGHARLDLSGVTFLDSSGIHALIRLARAGDVTISSDLRPAVRKVLEVSGLLGALPFDGG